MKDPTIAAVVSALIGIAFAIALAEIKGLSGWITRRLITRAVKRLPEQSRAELEEDWYAEYDRWDNGTISRLVWALGLPSAVKKLERVDSAVKANTRAPRGFYPGADGVMRAKFPGNFTVIRQADGLWTLRSGPLNSVVAAGLDCIQVETIVVAMLKSSASKVDGEVDKIVKSFPLSWKDQAAREIRRRDD